MMQTSIFQSTKQRKWRSIVLFHPHNWLLTTGHVYCCFPNTQLKKEKIRQSEKLNKNHNKYPKTIKANQAGKDKKQQTCNIRTNVSTRPSNFNTTAAQTKSADGSETLKSSILPANITYVGEQAEINGTPEVTDLNQPPCFSSCPCEAFLSDLPAYKKRTMMIVSKLCVCSSKKSRNTDRKNCSHQIWFGHF